MEDSKHFMKAILPSPFHTKQIRIPDEFITRFGNELGNVAKITVPDGRQWDMELKKCGNGVFLYNKWQEFAEYYSISYGCYLDFKYEGNSEFNVVIYDATSVEICYPFKTPTTNGESNTNCPSPKKKVKNMSNYSSKRAKDTANECNPKNPSFRSRYIKATRSGYVYVPREFAAKYLKLKVSFKLQNSQGKQWDVSCISNAKRSSSMRIAKGLPGFARENNPLKKHIYEFQLIKMKPVVVLLHRQQNCVLSLAEEEVREPKHFKKAILPSPIHAKQIKIPDNFITLFGNELNNVAKVTVPDGRVWDIELKKCGENIVYPPPLNTKCGRPRKRSRVEINDADNLPSDEDDEGSKNPCFTTIIKHQRLYINADFAKKYLKPNVAVKLQNCNGEQWEVYCLSNDSRSSAMRLGRGFAEFLTDNNLSDGDGCKVELIKKMPVVLKLVRV
ncbi:hypothetical protein P8452_18926 [Trifolium repens]|nr:hypothetical protein P8452_18926 [Trifolium repens]